MVKAVYVMPQSLIMTAAYNRFSDIYLDFSEIQQMILMDFLLKEK